MIDNEYYWYGIAMTIYLLSCWFFSIMRIFHTCQQPKERRAYIWPDRKLQAIIYLMSRYLLFLLRRAAVYVLRNSQTA